MSPDPGRPSAIRLSARLLVEDGGRLLVARALEGGHTFLPGGGVEPGEPVAEAALRELEEEAGLARSRVQVGAVLGVLEHSWTERGRGFHHLDLVMAARVAGLGAGDPVPAREPHLSFGWVAWDDLATANLFPRAYRTLLPRWRDGAGARFASDMAGR